MVNKLNEGYYSEKDLSSARDMEEVLYDLLGDAGFEVETIYDFGLLTLDRGVVASADNGNTFVIRVQSY